MKTKLKKLPKITRSKDTSKDASEFAVKKYSHSSMALFSTNPILFKIKYINGDYIETSSGISGVIGQAFHKAMEVYYGGDDRYVPSNEAEALEYGLKAGMEHLERYNDGFINFSDSIPTKQKAFEIFSFAFTEYTKKNPYSSEDTLLDVEQRITTKIDVEWSGKRLNLPVPLDGFIDKVVRGKDGKIRIIDYKTSRAFSNPEKIDARKILQSIQYYLLAYAQYGEEPYSLTFEEVKYTKNRDGGDQVKKYEVIFSENELYFDFYFRYYEDITRALNGEMVYVPNIDAFYDNEVAIIAYIHRLDEPETRANLMKKLKVDNITDLLKKKIQSAGNMRKLMKTVERQFVEAKSIDYSKMKLEEKIKVKLMEHGIMLDFDSVVHGPAVSLYRYSPTMGVKMKNLKSYVDDIEQVTGKSGVRILAPIPDSTLVGFEIPNDTRTFPSLPSMQGFDIAIGQTVDGTDYRFDIRRAPHLLVAGSTGSGKSVFLNGLIQQLKACPDTELHLFDPKQVELFTYEGTPGVVQYEHDVRGIAGGLDDLTKEMERRYSLLKGAGKRNIEEYGPSSSMPYKFVVIDEYADLMLNSEVLVKSTKKRAYSTKSINALRREMVKRFGSNERFQEEAMTKGDIIDVLEQDDENNEASKFVDVASTLQLLAQKGRACGIHLVLATQRASTNVVSGDIKVNFPTRVVFRMAKEVDSRVMLDESGAERLMGKGDCLFAGEHGIIRLQGYNV